MVLILGVSFLFLLGGAAFFIMGKRAKPQAPAAPEPIKTTQMTMDDIVVNLADSDQARYLSVGLTLEVKEEDPKDEKGGGEGEKAADPDLPIIKDSAIAAMSSYNFSDLLSNEGKEKLKKSVREGINKALKRDFVQKVYFTSFTMQ
jgi:flagellar basal body-associated protein FliL